MQIIDIDLNEYAITKNIGDCDLIIQPAERQNGTRPAPIMYAKTTVHKKQPRVTNEMILNGEAVWRPAVEIDPNAIPTDYLACINWWFKNLNSNDKDAVTYRKMLSDNYPTIDMLSGIKEVRRQLEGYHTYTSVAKNGKTTYTKRHKSIGKKISVLLSKWEKNGKFNR